MDLVREETTFTLRDKRWYYKGEGNVNVVLAVPADGTVVRVMKSDGSAAAAALSVLVRYRDAVDRLFFADGDYTDVPTPMTMSANELRDIDECVRRDRPPDRQHKRLGWTSGLVAVCPDYTVLPATPLSQPNPIYCVEVKPKQGWLHEADRAARRGSFGTARCVFCAHQYLKLSRGDIREVSRYCPLDLFSGRRERACRAIRRLFSTPQNNLKVFVDGQPADRRDFGRAARETFGDVGRLCSFVAAVLLGAGYGDMDACPATVDGGGDEDASRATDDDCGSPRTDRPPCNFDAVPMPPHCVLHKILTMQMMQTTGFADVCSAYERRSPRAAQFDHVDSLFAAADPESVSGRPVDGYLVAATAQDCSVFVTFSRMTRDERTEHVVRFGGLRYAVRVKVSDLDPKPLSTVEKHRKRNADVLLAYKRYLDRVS